MRRASSVLASLALCGCCGMPIGDDVFTVSGSTPMDAKSCEVLLRSQSGEELQSTRRKISGRFRVDFPVVTCGADYQVVVFCDGTERTILTAR
jgi:hypothetical protein